ncbi:hypothetical protein DUI87_20999 [Hirundo rustica rustica]|uniref:Uncharacterized protein n=1 Tax=Hirundo rustica rustica TaxID=333673 RepID=A0A3M0JL78_HIRRU|nr:hypothetical protein DUI87_20999 [Hirundo rustica rustica]
MGPSVAAFSRTQGAALNRAEVSGFWCPELGEVELKWGLKNKRNSSKKDKRLWLSRSTETSPLCREFQMSNPTLLSPPGGHFKDGLELLELPWTASKHRLSLLLLGSGHHPHLEPRFRSDPEPRFRSDLELRFQSDLEPRAHLPRPGPLVWTTQLDLSQTQTGFVLGTGMESAKGQRKLRLDCSRSLDWRHLDGGKIWTAVWAIESGVAERGFNSKKAAGCLGFDSWKHWTGPISRWWHQCWSPWEAWKSKVLFTRNRFVLKVNVSRKRCYKE